MMKLLNHIKKLYLILKLNLFAWKLIRGRDTIREKPRKIGMGINGDSPICNSHLENIDHFFIQCPIVGEEWSTIVGYCPTLIIGNNYLNWIGYI